MTTLKGLQPDSSGFVLEPFQGSCCVLLVTWGGAAAPLTPALFFNACGVTIASCVRCRLSAHLARLFILSLRCPVSWLRWYRHGRDLSVFTLPLAGGSRSQPRGGCCTRSVRVPSSV